MLTIVFLLLGCLAFGQDFDYLNSICIYGFDLKSNPRAIEFSNGSYIEVDYSISSITVTYYQSKDGEVIKINVFTKIDKDVIFLESTYFQGEEPSITETLYFILENSYIVKVIKYLPRIFVEYTYNKTNAGYEIEVHRYQGYTEENARGYIIYKSEKIIERDLDYLKEEYSIEIKESVTLKMTKKVNGNYFIATYIY